MKTLNQAMLDKIFYIGKELPEDMIDDPRPKFILLGTPQQLLDEVADKDQIIKMLRKALKGGCTNTIGMAIELIENMNLKGGD